MKCPHCRVEIHEGFDTTFLPKNTVGQALGKVDGADAHWAVTYMVCPACEGFVLRLHRVTLLANRMPAGLRDGALLYPRRPSRLPAPAEVPPELAEDFNEACLVLSDSPKASAALSRRCLQGVLRGQGFNQKDLAPAIDAALASKQLPSSLATSLDAIRNIGNFAAHPMKDQSSGSILPVEPAEAEWNLDVLEGLFDFYFVQPAKAQAKIVALNQKLQTAGKPPIKS